MITRFSFSDIYLFHCDVGIRTTHQDFGGRAQFAFAAPGLPQTDDNGHGQSIYTFATTKNNIFRL
jgi:cerevisin